MRSRVYISLIKFVKIGLSDPIFKIYLPNFVIYILTTCWNVNKGKIYLENTKIKANKVRNENVN